MNNALSAATLLPALLLAASASAAGPDSDVAIRTLPAVQVRPDVAWVGNHPQNERIVTLATVTVRPDVLTRLHAGALDAVALLPQVEPIQLPSLHLELPRLPGLGHAARATPGAL